ncbi:flavin reductase [Maribacter arenosus]|uniref:Flavin reductase n=1 Tax=Maribacter arenosus TaxID=1854708 RepID=A0ABR7VFH1_9FLAO|nr:flavin reductase [Maribacter arenosus]MBD0851098.1 flavin reductase [Maribacter arenosus]
MDTLKQDGFISLDLDLPIWERFFTVAPLVVVGTKEDEGYDLAPKHMVTPLGFGNFFGFVCTSRHSTYHNVKKTKEFTVSFPRAEQIIATSISASPRKGETPKSLGIIEALPIVKATTMNAPLLRDSYLYFECKLFKIIDGFDGYALITGTIKAVYVHRDYLRVSEGDDQLQLKQNPLLAYIANGRFAKVSDTYNFPFPKDFKR